MSEPRGGNCYEVALIAFGALTLGRAVPPGVGLWLCHGWPIGQGPILGVKHGHAWLELDVAGATVCIDYSNGKACEMFRDDYYALGQIEPDEVRRYAFREMQEMVKLHEHYGPWEGAEPGARYAMPARKAEA